MFLKHRKKYRLSRSERRKRRQTLIYLGIIALVVACAGGIALLSLLNGAPSGSRYVYTTENDIWYVKGGQVEVAAAEAQPASDPAEAAQAP